MQRDMELVRKILLAIEASPDERLPTQPLISGSSDKEVNYHLGLLHDGGFIEALTFKGGGQVSYSKIGMTWKGHEFLDTARDDTIWAKAKATLGSGFNAVSLAVLQELLVGLVKARFGLP